MHIRNVFFCVTLALSLGIPWLWLQARALPVAQPGQGQPTANEPHFRLMGTASCAGRSCHGAIEPLGKEGEVQQNEFTRWISRDRHAEAYRVLETDRSKKIEAALQQVKDYKSMRPQEDRLCLDCHVAPNVLARAAVGSSGDAHAFVGNFDGVGCETCHGPAEKWLHDHALPEWKKKNAKEKADLGMHSLKTPAERAEQCVGCHVGSALADVNHDLIAAGHPRLAFEFGAYFANMPHHWGKLETDAKPEKEMESWAVGQVVTGQAALRLLQARAEDTKKPWPEFAAYDCFACHHDLHHPSWRQERSSPGPTLGALLPDTWYPSMPKALAAVEKEPPIPASLNALDTLLQRRLPGREKAAQDANSAAKSLADFQKQVQDFDYKEAACRKRLAALAALLDVKRMTWDEAAQFYLALAAFDQAYPGDKKLHEAIAALYKSLAFPKDEDSPSDDKPSRDEFVKAFNEVKDLLK
jgi:hypothetical protein